MRMSAHVRNSQGEHRLEVSSGDHQTVIAIAPKASGFGSGVSGGELLLAALATCYCNDLYREAGKMGINISGVEVECSADFPAEGQPAQEVTYSARIRSAAPESRIRELAAQTDRLAEIHNTVRTAISVRLTAADTQAE